MHGCLALCIQMEEHDTLVAVWGLLDTAAGLEALPHVRRDWQVGAPVSPRHQPSATIPDSIASTAIPSDNLA